MNKFGFMTYKGSNIQINFTHIHAFIIIVVVVVVVVAVVFVVVAIGGQWGIFT